MKKIILVIAIVGIFGTFVAFQNKQKIKDLISGNESRETSEESSASPMMQPSSAPMVGRYKDGTYTGTVADATYGNIQVQITIQGGKITGINYLQSPDHPGHTTEVSNMALPLLKQEAITAQNSNVDIVSGATQTSQGFMVTLQSALDQAKSSS